MSKIRILAPHFVDVDNFNAQSLNLRDIAVRLDSTRFEWTLFYRHEPDPRLSGHSHIRLNRIPERMGSFAMLWKTIQRQDILFNPAVGLKFTDLYFQLPEVIRKRTRTVQWIEGVIKGNLADAGPYVNRNFERFGRRMDVYVAITDFVARTSLEDYQIKAKLVIPVGVNTSLYSPTARKASQPVKVLFVGHLIERKGAALVLEAAKTFRQVEFSLVGKARGNYQQKLDDLVSAYQLTNVTFLEPMPPAQLATVMNEHDLLLHPSQVEGMPKVVLEAAAAGLPAIIFDTYQAPVVVDGVSGYQVSTFDDMLARLRELIEDASLRRKMGQAAVEHARQYDWDNIARHWEALFLAICEGSEKYARV